ncbi:MAG: FHA domain-containing protein [Bacteroidales bacterium]|nr:FHA domain-containing protein [Bacteroidales bacterium]
MEKIKYKLICPRCGRRFVGGVSDGVDIATAKVRCPNVQCNYFGKGAGFLPPINANSDATVREHDRTDVLHTEIERKKKNTDVGQIRIVSDGRIYPLHEGINTFGRKANNYEPNKKPETQIVTDDMTMSRCHARIDVKRSPRGNGYVFHMQDTSLNGINLNEREIPSNAVIILNYGDKMVWGDTEVIFEESR